MLLTRLTERAARQPGPAFHRDRRCHWQLNIDSTAGAGMLRPLIDQDGRGANHTTPMMGRTVDIVAMLTCDKPSYALGWGTHSRARQRHAAFVDLHDRWATSEPEDPIAQAIAAFYRAGGVATLASPSEMTDEDLVLLSVDGQWAYRAPTLSRFWFGEVTRVKGRGRNGLCLVCGQVGPLAQTVPNVIAGKLVPEATPTGAALVTVNADSIGYDNTTGLQHTPICMSCSDAFVQGLTMELSSPHSRVGLGQTARTTWWTTVDEVFTGANWLEEPPTPQDIAHFVDSVRAGTLEKAPDDTAFCALTVTGCTGRISVVDWREYTIGAIREHIADWWEDHEISTHRGPGYFSITRLTTACGRWDKTTSSYMPPPKAGEKKNDPHRPPWLRRDLLQTAYRGDRPPAALIGHLLHRIRSDQHIDAVRAALLRLAHNRSTKDSSMTPGLDPTHNDTAYLAGRLFALHAGAQIAAHRYRSGKPGDAEGEDRRSKINTTYENRHLAGAITKPQAAVVAGQRDLPAWLKVLHRERPGLAAWFEREIAAVINMVEPETDFPAVASLAQQSQFILGFWHQRSRRSAKTAVTSEAENDEPVEAAGATTNDLPVTEEDPFAELGITV